MHDHPNFAFRKNNDGVENNQKISTHNISNPSGEFSPAGPQLQESVLIDPARLVDKKVAGTLSEKGVIAFHRRLLKEHGEPVYRSWLAQLVFEQAGAQKICFSLPTSFKTTIVRQRYLESLKNSFEAVFFPTASIEVVVNSARLWKSLPKKNTSSVRRNTPSARTAAQEKTASIDPFANGMHTPLDRSKRFDTFICSDVNRLAYTAALGIAAQEEKGPLYIFGESGCGKTHLLHAMGNAVACKYPQKTIIYATHDAFTESYVDAHLHSGVSAFFASLLEADIFLMDDIHLLASRRGTQKALTQLVEKRNVQGKLSIVAGTTSPAGLIEIGLTQRLVSRLRMGLCVGMQRADYALRLAFLRVLRGKNMHGKNIGDDVLCELAKKVDGSLREVEGAMRVLLLQVKGADTAIDLAVARRLIAQQFVAARGPIQIQDVIKGVVDVFGVSFEDIKSRRRSAVIVRARHAAALLAKEFTECSYSAIGAVFDRDHSTILAGVRRAEDLQRTDKTFANRLDLLRRRLCS